MKMIKDQRSSNKRKVWEEKDIPSQEYDIPQIQENWVDPESLTRYLQLKKWCLCLCENVSSEEILDKDAYPRQPLPEDGKFLSTHIIFGSLDPNQESSSPTAAKTISIVIKQPKSWVFDRSRNLRGIWVQSSMLDIWYWLKDPSTDTLDSSPSQEILQIPLRAKIGLLSNILDMVQETNQGKPFNYVPIIGKRHPELVHRMLTPTYSQWEYFRHLHVQSDEDVISDEYPFLSNIMGRSFLGRSYPLLNQEPFDLDLLKTCADFIHRHLTNIHPYLSKSSNFMRGLVTMHTDYVQYIKSSSKSDLDSTVSPTFKHFSLEEYVTSAVQSEERSFRQPWGELAHNLLVQPNRWIEFIVQYNLTDINDVPIPNDGTAFVQEEILCDSVQCIMRGVKEKIDEIIPKNTSKINIRLIRYSTIAEISSDYQQMSSTQLCLAFRGLSSILLPTPTPSELLARNIHYDDITKYQFAEKCTSSVMNMILGDYPDSQGFGHVGSMEWMFIIIDVLRRSGPKMMRTLFKSKTKDKDSLSPFAIIYRYWLSLAIHRLKATSSIDKAQLITERRFIQSAMKFIVDCTVINTMNQIIILTKLSVDWFYIIDKTLEFAISNNFSEIIESAKAARKHLDTIRADTLSLNEETVDSSLAVPIVKITSSPVPVVNAAHTTNTNKPETQDKEMMQKRLSQLLRIAKNNAGDLVQRPPMNQLDVKTNDTAGGNQIIDLSKESKTDTRKDKSTISLGTNLRQTFLPRHVENDHHRNVQSNPAFLNGEYMGTNANDNDFSIHTCYEDSSDVNIRIETSSSQNDVSKEERDNQRGSVSGWFPPTTEKLDAKVQEAKTVDGWSTANATNWTVSSWANAAKLPGSTAPSWGSWKPKSENETIKGIASKSLTNTVGKIMNDITVDATAKLVSTASNSLGSLIRIADPPSADASRGKYDGNLKSEKQLENRDEKISANTMIGSANSDDKVSKAKTVASGWSNTNATEWAVSSWANATKLPGSTAPSWGSLKPIMEKEKAQITHVQSTTDYERFSSYKPSKSATIAPSHRTRSDKSFHVAPLAQDHGDGCHDDKTFGLSRKPEKYMNEDGEIDDDQPTMSRMKRKISDLSDKASKMDVDASEVRSLNAAQSEVRVNAHSPSSTAGKGRGRGRVLPAWMSAPTQEYTNSTLSLPESFEKVSNPRMVSDVSSSLQVKPEQNGMVSDLSSSLLGRGRGRDRNLPAWMTAQKSND